MSIDPFAEITMGFIIIQVIVSIAGYTAHQIYNFPLNRILIFATIFSILLPLITLNPKEADLELTQNLINQYVGIIPQQVIGVVIGTIVTSIIHMVRK